MKVGFDLVKIEFILFGYVSRLRAYWLC